MLMPYRKSLPIASRIRWEPQGLDSEVGWNVDR
jgi:hypothetical protein